MRLIFFLTFLLLAPFSYAAEYWKASPTSTLPWDDAKSMVAFNNTLFISGTKSGSSDNLWSSTDGTNWQISPMPPPFFSGPQIVTSFTVHNGALYGFVTEGSSVTCNVIRTVDGQSWTRVGHDQFLGATFFSDSISFGNYIYAGDNNGRIWRSNGQGNPLTWENAQSPFSTPYWPTKRSVSFVVRGNALTAACSYEDLFYSNTLVASSNDGINWGPYFNSQIQEEKFRSSAVEFNGDIYWGALTLRKSNFLSPPNISWGAVSAGFLPSPFVLNDQLHVYGPNSQILVMDSQQNWSVAGENPSPYCSTDKPKYGKSATIGNTTYLLPCNLISITNGIDSVNNLDFSPSIISPGQANVPVLRFETKVNFQEIINMLRIVNYGTAMHWDDIMALSLHRKTENADIRVKDFIFNRNLGSWTLSPGSSVEISDGEIYEVKADISKTAINGRTLQFSVLTTGMAFSVRPGFSLSNPITAPHTQAINVPASAPVLPIEKVEIYPNPARDIVQIHYTLDETSDVTIKIFDRAGRMIEEIIETSKAPGLRTITTWNAGNVAPGLYFVRIEIKNASGERAHKTQIAIER